MKRTHEIAALTMTLAALGCPSGDQTEPADEPTAPRDTPPGTDVTSEDQLSKPAETPLRGTQWMLETLRGEPAGQGAGGQTPFLLLDGEAERLSGFAGCNRMAGGYELEGSRISFGGVAMTRMACPEGMELERRFGKALADTQRYAISEGVLTLFAEGDRVLATFKAR